MTDRKWIEVEGYACEEGDGDATRLYYDLLSGGELDDGVGFEHGSEGAWIVRIEDMERVCREVRADRDGTENASTDLADDEIALIVKGLWAIDSDEPGVPELVKKLGF